MLRIDLVQAGSSCGSEKSRASHQRWPLVVLQMFPSGGGRSSVCRTGPQNNASSPPCTERDVEYPNDLKAESIPVLHGLHIILLHLFRSTFFLDTNAVRH